LGDDTANFFPGSIKANDMKTIIATLVSLAFAIPAFAATSTPTPTPAPTPVTVGVDGNEPLIAKAPDGTLYISALQHI